ncbi:MAG: GNAT family N-acetyltransferase [Holosporaceae bacterium]|jgi:RimJ/RimL family protein N-acetyltransferase|nr:GNAT family N-acetyltransferase [Holosporaceae bacterium]
MPRKLFVFLILIAFDFLSNTVFVDELLVFQQMRLINTCLLAEKLSMNPIAVSCLLFTFNGPNEYALVPIAETKTCREFWRTIFSGANPLYMTFYANGGNKTKIEADINFKKRVSRMWNSKGPPDAMTFISLYNGLPSGEISIGPLRIFGIYPEVGFITMEKFSHKGVASTNLKLMVNFIRTLVEKNVYTITHLQATCHPHNTPSSKTLKRSGFQLIKNYSFTNHGLRDLYEMPMVPQ